MNEWVITTVITLGIGVVSYFLKRTMSHVDRHDTETVSYTHLDVYKRQPLHYDGTSG